MGSTIQFPSTSAEGFQQPAVTHSHHYRYQDIQPCTLRNIDHGRFGVYQKDAALGEYVLVSAYDRYAEATLALYKLVNNSDYLIAVDTCHECWAVMPLTGERVRRDYLLFCSKKCADVAADKKRGSWQLRVAVVISVFAISGGFWYGLYQAAMYLFPRLGIGGQ